MDKSEAEKRLESALEHTKAAAHDLVEVLIRGCEGSSNIRMETGRVEHLRKALVDLIGITANWDKQYDACVTYTIVGGEE